MFVKELTAFVSLSG